MILRRRRTAAPQPAPEPAGQVVVVTDSTSGLSTSAASGGVDVIGRSAPCDDFLALGDVSKLPSLSGGVDVIVPLQIITADGPRSEGVDISSDDVVARVAAGEVLTTSQPAPVVFADAYRTAAASGAPGVVSVHLSGELSGTAGVARFAAGRAMLPVRVVDSRTAAGCLGFAAKAAVECATAGADLEHVAARAQQVAANSHGLFLVDSLEHLRRGGRLSATATALGGALGLKPILEMRQGRIEAIARVRSRRLAVGRLGELVIARAASATNLAVVVHHFGAPERAHELAAQLGDALQVAPAVTPISAVLGVHLGPGAIAVAIADLGDHSH